MRKFVAIFLLLALSTSYGYAQRTDYLSSFATQSLARSYFERNLSELDEIEGSYDVSIIPKYSGGNMLSGLRHWGGNEYSSRAFIAKQANGKYVCKLENGGKVYLQGNLYLEKLGSTNAYRVTGTYSEHYNHFGNSGTLSFNISTRTTYQYPAFTIEFKGNDEFHRVEMLLSFVKVYPDAYAIQERIEIESTPTEWSGTGFALKGNYIVTNYHVIEDAKSIWIQGVNGDFNTKYTASVVASDKFNDLALLKVEGVTVNTSGIPYSVKTSTSEVGEDVFVLGYPLTSTMGEEIKLTTGVVSSKTGFQGDVSLYQISAPIQPGNSGGPLFDGDGNVIGIVSAKHKGAENVGYAIKASYLRNLMESALSENILPQTNKIASYKLSDKVKSLKNYVYYITCSSSNSNNSSLNNSNNTGGSVSSATEKTYHNPYINRNMSNSLKVLSVKVQDNQTVITFSDNNRIDDDSYYQWFTMNKNAYIVANGQKYTLTRAEGIAISPDKTYFSYAGETKTFTLYFPAIPKSTTSIDFIEAEDSDWRLYGIQLR